MNRKILLILGGVVLIGLIVWLVLPGKDATPTESVSNRGVVGEPVSITLDFIQPWLSALRATNTDPFALDLHNSMEVSESMSAQLLAYKQSAKEGDMDPVLCQVTPPESLRAKAILESDTEVQVSVISAKKDLPGQALVTLNKNGEKWMVTNISCTSGEQAPVTEFDFQQAGVLLKSVPPPLEAGRWHLVFERDGVIGHTVPLYFTADSECLSKSGEVTACDPNTFTEPTAVEASGDMGEEGLSVKRLQF